MYTNEELAAKLAAAEGNVRYYAEQAAWWRDELARLTTMTEERLKAQRTTPRALKASQ